MLEHVILMRLADGARDAVAAEVRATLGALTGIEVRVGVPADADAEVWDLLVVLVAADPATLGRALADPAAVALEARLAERVVVRKGWTFLLKE